MTGKKDKDDIPKPPAGSASADELASYFEKYGLEELESAGYVQDLDSLEHEKMLLLKQRAQNSVDARKNSRTI